MIKTVSLSLRDILGESYVNSLLEGYTALRGIEKSKEVKKLADKKVDFFSEDYAKRLDELLPYIGKTMINQFSNKNKGAATESINEANNSDLSPAGTYGYYRLGENGKLFAITKSEHYHCSIGHSFAGFDLMDKARALGIPHATHNTTRGYVTRLLEREIIRSANCIDKKDDKLLDDIISSNEPNVLNRIINLDTGSLATEAAIKMVLAKHYKLMPDFPTPEYQDRIPVFLVMGGDNDELAVNYHGTTLLTQYMRGMWPDYVNKAEENGMFLIKSVKINNIEDFKNKVEKYNKPPYKTAAFIHEIILMNHGCFELEKDYLQEVYNICDTTDTATICDEIQTCMWYKDMYLFPQYGIKPDFIAIGKGFSGGTTPASKILTTAEYDNLNLFGALVTNGQDDLAALAYLITMEFAIANRAHIEEIGNYYHDEVISAVAKYETVANIKGKGLLLAIHFNTVEVAEKVSKRLNERGFDVAAQTYKKNCSPAAITKLPWIVSKKFINVFISNIVDIIETSS